MPNRVQLHSWPITWACSIQHMATHTRWVPGWMAWVDKQVQCVNKHAVNVTNWNLTLSDVKLQPFNITSDGMYGTIEDCSYDTKDDWLVPGLLSLLNSILLHNFNNQSLSDLFWVAWWLSSSLRTSLAGGKAIMHQHHMIIWTMRANKWHRKRPF